MMLMLLVLGCFVDQVSMMLITLPFFMPLVQHFGWDPLWFGVIFLICMQLGLLTPPFGMLLCSRWPSPAATPSSSSPASATRRPRCSWPSCCKQAGLPDGVFNVVQGDKVAVDTLLEHPT
jgi:hypothetical protein